MTGGLDIPGGDPTRTFAALFDAYASSLYRYLAGRGGAALADDLVSETFLVALRQRDRFDPTRGTPEAWLFGIATNLLRHHHRSQMRHLAAVGRLVAPDEAVAAAGNVAEGVARRLDAIALVEQLVPALLQLKPTDLDILLLNAWAHLEPSEIASALGMPAATVRTRLHRMRRTLRSTAPLSTDDADAGGPSPITRTTSC